MILTFRIMAKQRLLTRVLTSIFFKRANIGAVRYARNSTRIFALVREALNKSGGLSGKNISVFREQIALLTRMLRAYASGDYKQLPWKSLVSIIGVLLYFLNPIDILPDILPIVGIVDDIALVGWLFTSVSSDIDRFRQWEQGVATPAEEASRPGRNTTQTIKIG
ncbi:protein of unknown function DUF1232 [Fibrisoma limi BUZ 3]|uniref:DUF1232 domain-containing protein n=2 Tax=Fibrisoma limi TaxID=663275 RepID=I2GTN7_9BACT|nr:protein of unknown function DUF1232 [Fibrisoma limi BUZ 3]